MEDADGARYDIKLEGNVTRDKVLKIFEMMDLMNIEEEELEAEGEATEEGAEATAEGESKSGEE